MRKFSFYYKVVKQFLIYLKKSIKNFDQFSQGQHTQKMLSSRQSYVDEAIYYKPTQKQITALLVKIQAKPHEIKDYKQFLLRKQQFQKENQIIVGGFQKLAQILDPKYDKINFVDSNNSQNYEAGGICPKCYEEIRGKGINCNICKKIVCRNCLARNRMMKNSSVYKFCQPCDQKYMQAGLNKQFLKQFTLYQKAFETLIRQQQNLEFLMNTERQRVKKQTVSEQKQVILRNEDLIHQLKRQKQAMKQKIQQTQNKIDWGQSMTKTLKIKHRKAQKILKQSFASSNSDSVYVDWQPPKAQDDLNYQIDINQSFITSNLQRNEKQEPFQEEAIDKQFCKCQLI